jgi:4-amino-4-deoxy-L-arabinose transferase-like glycosyltransferase
MIDRIRRLSRFESPTKQDWGIYFIAFIILQIPAIINFYQNNGLNNGYTLFAESLLHGKLSLPKMAYYGDMVHYGNNYYLPYPPLPSIILLPFVAIFGASQVNTVAIATLISCINLYLLYKILVRLQIPQSFINWLLLAFIFGTGYWFALFTSHHVYAFAHIISILFQFLLINELLGKKRWWLAGIFIGCTFLTRQFTIFYVVFALIYMLYINQEKRSKLQWRTVLELLSPIGLFIVIYMAYNYERFGNVFDTGYDHIIFIGVLKERVDQFGVFNIRYFLFNLYSVLIKGFNIDFQGKTYLNIKDMDLWGTSVLAASPFLVASLKAQWPKFLKIGAWITVVIILTGQLFYHNNGLEQVNTSRFTLDFLPLLFVLTALGAVSIPKWLFKGMVVYALLLNVISFAIHYMYQG